MEEATTTPEQTEEKDPFSPADVLTISITRARVEMLRKTVADLVAFEMEPFYRDALGDILYYLNTAVLTRPAPEVKTAPYPDVNDEQPLFMPVEEMVKPAPVYEGPGIHTP